jgi:hypothetical protein
VSTAKLRYIAPFPARHLAPSQRSLLPALRARGRAVHVLTRRGVDLGCALPLSRRSPSSAEARARWAAAEAVFLPGVVARRLPPFAAAIARTLQMFARLRAGRRLLDELDVRLRDDDTFRYAGSTADKNDAREVERVFVDAEVDGAAVAQDLWAMLAWIAHDESDSSLRIRFSHGKDKQDEWMTGGDHIAGWSDTFAAACFPECAISDGSDELHAWLDQLVARPHRLSERIVYNNAPGGGAVFHHDAEPGQLGVAFHQLQGSTAWLAIGKRRLAAALHQVGDVASVHAGMAALDADDPRVYRRINRDAAFTARLAALGALFVLDAGDCILLPSHGTDDVAWHSVIALGTAPSLAHSYGIFPRDVVGRRPRR